MRLPSPRSWVLTGSVAAAVVAVLATTVVVRAALSGGRAHPGAAPSPEPSLTPSAASPTPVETTASPTPYDSATADPWTADPTTGPIPPRLPGKAYAMFQFNNFDPEYDAVFWIGTDRYGPFRPWARSALVKHATYAGLQFRLEFPKRHNCDTAARPLDRPITGEWGLDASRVYLSHECSGLSVTGEPVKTYGVVEPWTFDTPTPTPSRPPSPPATSTTPAPTPTPTPTEESSVSPSP